MRSALMTLMFAGAIAAAAPGMPIANEALLHSARMWEAHERGDLAMLALQKLIAARPDAPEALLELGELALRMDDLPTARQVRDELLTRFKQHAATATFEFEYRLATRDRLQLASLKRLIETGQLAAARTQFDTLFPQGAPQGDLSLQYYELLARLPGTWQRVYDGLSALSARRPDQPRYRYALARHLLRRDAFAEQGIRLLDELGQRDDIRVSEVDDSLASALQAQGPQAPLDILQRYVGRHGNDTAAVNLLAQIKSRQQAEQQWRREVLRLIAPDAQAVNALQIDAELETRRRAQPDLDDALTTLHALERELTAADPGVEQIVGNWHARGRASLHDSRYADARLELAIALALRRHAFESTIALAEQLESRGLSNDAGQLLESASEFDPQSNWLFETRVRWLITHNQPTQALALLERRPLDAKFTPRLRAELQAAALQQRAENAADAAAMTDLQAALALSPRDAWLRYRLAQRYAAHGERERGRDLMNEGAQLAPTDAEMRYAQALFLESIDDREAALAALQTIAPNSHSAAMTALQQRLERAQALREIDALLEQRLFDAARDKLDALLASEPQDRTLRIRRADLELRAHRPQAACERYAVLVAEQPDDVDTRLDYVRALIDNGDTQLARLQLQAARQHAARDDAKLQLRIAWRAWSLNDAALTAQVLEPALPQLHDDADAWLLAGRSDLALRRFPAAHDHLLHAEQLQTGAASAAARALRLALDSRLDTVLNVGLQARHKPGDAGISKFDSLTIPSAWQWALDYERRLTLRADAVALDAGTLSDNFSEAGLFGTLYSAGDSAQRNYRNDTQRGIAFGFLYDTDFTTFDVGTTPLGFELPQFVGGAEWRPALTGVDVKLGVSRRAVTSSVLSYAGMRDPITGIKWGGVTATGPYVQLGRYREQYSVSGALRITQLSGTHVESNRFVGARLSSDYRWLDLAHDASWLGVTVNYWQYRHNLQNYTFGSGGYYSPQHYVSLALPLEWQGMRNDWSYQLRGAIAYSHSRVERTAYYRNDSTLQQQAILQAQAANDGEPWFAASSGGSVSFSASAKVEHLLNDRLVVGSEFSLDRADYYHPVELSLYVRRVFGGRAALSKPPRALRPYND